MSQTVEVGGTAYTIPDQGDPPNWGTNLTPFFVALAAEVSTAPAFFQNVAVNSTPVTVTTEKTYLVASNSITATLNLPAPVQNLWFAVKDSGLNAGTNNITIHRFGSEQINGVASDFVITKSGGFYMFGCNGTNWYLLANPDGFSPLNATNQIVLTPASGKTVTITAPAPAASRTYTVPDTGANSSFVMTDLAQTINGVKTFSAASLFSAGTAGAPGITFSGDATLGFYMQASNTLGFCSGGSERIRMGTGLLHPTTNNGMDLGTSGLNWNNAYLTTINNTTLNGLTINAGASGGAGTINIFPSTASKGSIQFVAADNAGNTVTTITNAAQAAVRTYTIPDAGASASFVMTAGTQTVGGAKSFSSAIAITATSAHIVLSTASNTATIQANSMATTGRTFSIPDISGNGTFAFLEGTQNFTGAKTFSAAAGNPIHGTNTNDSASAGYVGEYMSANNSTSTNFPSSTHWGDANSLALTAGDWDVTFQIVAQQVGATWTQATIGISSTTGDSATGLVNGDNELFAIWASSSTTPTNVPMLIANYRVSLSGSATYYGKVMATYSAGNPQYVYRLSARRIR